MQNKSPFSRWRINQDLYCLQDEIGNEKYVQPRLLKLLTVFLESPKKVISKTELIEAVWDDVVVGEESLSKAVFDLRKFLEDNFSDPPRIMTIRKVGYRFEISHQPVSIRVKTIKTLRKAAYVMVLVIIAILVIRGLDLGDY